MMLVVGFGGNLPSALENCPDYDAVGWGVWCWRGAVETCPNYDAAGGVRWKLAQIMMLLEGCTTMLVGCGGNLPKL